MNNDDDMNHDGNGDQELDNEVNQTSLADKMSSVATGVSADDSHRKDAAVLIHQASRRSGT